MLSSRQVMVKDEDDRVLAGVLGAKADAQAMVMALTMSESFMFGIFDTAGSVYLCHVIWCLVAKEGD